MKIVIISPVYPPYKSGISAVAEQDAKLLAGLGHEVTVLTPTVGVVSHDGVETQTLQPLFRLGNAAAVIPPLSLLRKADVVHLHYPFYGGDITTALLSLFFRKPLLVTAHHKAIATGLKGLVFRFYDSIFGCAVLQIAKMALVSTRDYAESVGFCHARLSEYPFSVDTERFHPGRDDAFRTEHNIPIEAIVGVFVGGLDTPHNFKGLEVLLSAMSRISEPNFYLIVVGDGDRRAFFEEVAAREGVGERVRFVGRLPDSHERAYRAADFHILPSVTVAEAFGIVTLEAMATGIPSIVSDLPGVRSLIHGGENGLLVAPRSIHDLCVAIEEMLQDPEKRRVRGARAREICLERYTLQVMAERLKRVYGAISDV